MNYYTEDDMLYYFIGDVHGCSKEFESLILKCIDDAESRNRKYNLFQLGDVIDRGPDLLEPFYLMKKYGINFVPGNHEHNFLLEHLINKPCRSLARSITHKTMQRCSVDEQELILDYCRQSPYFGVIRNIHHEQELIFSHSIYSRLEELITSSCLNDHMYNIFDFCGRSTNIDTEQLKEKRNTIHYVHGHMAWNYKQPEIYTEHKNLHIHNIDSGLVYEESDKYAGYLTALCVDNSEEGIIIDKRIKQYKN